MILCGKAPQTSTWPSLHSTVSCWTRLQSLVQHLHTGNSSTWCRPWHSSVTSVLHRSDSQHLENSGWLCGQGSISHPVVCFSCRAIRVCEWQIPHHLFKKKEKRVALCIGHIFLQSPLWRIKSSVCEMQLNLSLPLVKFPCVSLPHAGRAGEALRFTSTRAVNTKSMWMTSNGTITLEQMMC